MLLMTFIMAGPSAAMIQATGLIAAHLHDFLTRLWPTFGGGRNLVPTPGFIRRMWEPKTATVSHRAYGTAFAPARRDSSTSTGASGGVLPESWRNRGSGHRLGGDWESESESESKFNIWIMYGLKNETWYSILLLFLPWHLHPTSRLNVPVLPLCLWT